MAQESIMPNIGESKRNYQTSKLSFFFFTFSMQDFQINRQILPTLCPFMQILGFTKLIRSPCYSSNMLSTLEPQGLYTCTFFFLESSFIKYPHDSFSLSCTFRWHFLCEVFPDHLLPYSQNFPFTQHCMNFFFQFVATWLNVYLLVYLLTLSLLTYKLYMGGEWYFVLFIMPPAITMVVGMLYVLNKYF